MDRSWAVTQAARAGASVGALVGAPVAYGQSRIPGALVVAGFLLGAAIATQYALRRLETSKRVVTPVTLTAYAAVFFGLQAVPAADAYLAAIVVFAIIGLSMWLPSAWAGRSAQKGRGPTR